MAFVCVTYKAQGFGFSCISIARLIGLSLGVQGYSEGISVFQNNFPLMHLTKHSPVRKRIY